MNHLIASLIIFVFVGEFSAQPNIQWQKCLGGTGADNATEIQQTIDGGYIVTGKSLSTNGDVTGIHGATDFWVLKLDNNGDIQWQKSLGGSNNDWGYSIQQTSDGGYIVAGFTESNNGNVSGNHGDKDVWVVKLTSSGTVQWQKALGGTKSDEAWSIRQTSDNGFIVAGVSNSSDGDITGNHGFSDFWIVKLSNTGILEWQKSLGGSLEDIAYAVRQTADGGYIVTGETSSTDGDVTGAHESTDYWVVKLSSTGDLEWQKTLGTDSYDRANDVQQTSDDGYIVVGEVSANNGDVTGHHGGFDVWVVKLNAIGEIQWQKALGGSHEEFGRSVKQTFEGGYVITGSTQSTNGDVIGNNGGLEVWVVKLTSEGEINWQKTLGGTLGDWGNSIQQTNDGGFAIAGYTTSNDGDVSGIHGTSTDFWVVKLSPSSSGTSNAQMQPIEIFPNPASSSLTLQFPMEESFFNVTITDLLGRELTHHTLSNNDKIDIAPLPKGLYLLTASTASGKMFCGKFRKE